MVLLRRIAEANESSNVPGTQTIQNLGPGARKILRTQYNSMTPIPNFVG
jgi:hypothetical protein